MLEKKSESMNLKIKSSALQYTLVISILISIILFSFISLIYLKNKIKIKNSFYKKCIENVNLGFDFIANKKLEYNFEMPYQLNKNDNDSIFILKKHWGIFDLVKIRCKIKNEFYEKNAITGNNNSIKTALYLQENNKPLVISGHTEITGNIFIPKQGIKTGYFLGNPYYGNKLFNGEKRISKNTLPKIDENKLVFLKKNLTEDTSNSSLIHFNLYPNLIKYQKFTNKTAIYQNDNEIILKNITLRGNILIKSKKMITIEKSSTLNDIILIAPIIKIKDNVNGNFQCIASNKILFGKNCNLNYPSAAVIIKNKKNKTACIRLNENTIFNGILFFNDFLPNHNNFDTQIYISKKTKIIGEIYCNQKTELLGNVFGSVYTKEFIMNTNGRIYINHINDTKININKLPNKFCGLFPLQSKKNTKVAKWVL